MNYRYDAVYGPKTPLSSLYRIFLQNAETETMYFMCDQGVSAHLAALISRINLTFHDRIIFCNSPVDTEDEDQLLKLVEYAEKYSNDEDVPVGVSKRLKTPPTNVKALYQMETLFKVRYLSIKLSVEPWQILDLYLWLSNQFPHHFVDTEDVRQLAYETSIMIHDGIQLFGASAYETEKKKRKHEKKLSKKFRRQAYSQKNINDMMNWTHE